MLIEPTPAVPRSRGARLRLIASASVPIIGLLTVVTTGVLAGGTDGGDTDARRVAMERDAPAAAPERDDVTARDDSDLAVAAFPPRVLGLPIRDVSDVAARHAAGLLGDELVAVRGFLTVRPRLRGCLVADPGVSKAPLCRRETILSEIADPLLSWDGGVARWTGARSAAHLHPQALPGVSLAGLDTLAATSAPPSGRDGPIAPVPAIVIGRFDDPRLAGGAGSGQHVEAFSLERLVWAAGRWQDRGIARSVPRRDDELDPRDVRAIIDVQLSSGAVILSQSVIGPAMLARIESDAVPALPDPPVRPDLVWYVRTMLRTTRPPSLYGSADVAVSRRVAWLVIAADGAVLAVHTGG